MQIISCLVASGWKYIQDHKPAKVQNGVGPTKRIVSISIKCSEGQYSAVLSVYVIRTNTAEEEKRIQMNNVAFVT